MSEAQREQELIRIAQEFDEDESDRDDFSDDELEDIVPEADVSDAASELIIGGLSDIDTDDDDIWEPLHAENEIAQQQQERPLSDDYFLARDGTKWKKDPPPPGRIRAHNIFREAGGYAKRGMSQNHIDIFKSIMTEQMIDIIKRQTNRKAENETLRYNTENHPKKKAQWVPVTDQELLAYFGILLAAGVNHSNKQHTRELWKTNNDPVFRATMSINRFYSISRYIRFDDQRTRVERQQIDKAAAIRDIWVMLNHNLEAVYTPAESITVDEQLFPYRGNTKFTQYIPSKPARYGIKIWWACESCSGYPCKGILYTGKEQGQQREINQGERVLLELTKKYNSSGRTIVADNFFTTLDGVEKLQSTGLAFVGTLRKNKKYIPKEMLADRSRPVHSTVFGFTSNVALVSYVPKKNKTVLLLSSVHYDNEVVGIARKPQAIMFYNMNKGGVDRMDQMLGEYSCKRQTKRWPLALFYNILDVAALASFIIYKNVNDKTRTKNTDARRQFLHSLVKQLVTPQIEERMNNPRVIGKFSVKNGIESFFGTPIQNRVPEPSTSGISTQKKSCQICRINDKLQRKTRFACALCADPVCLQHSKQYLKCQKCEN